MFKFRRMRNMDPLQVAMTGVRMGERYLQVFCSDAALTRGLATKTGLSGVAALAAPDEAQATRARAAGTKAGALIDVKVTPVSTLEWPESSFDMVVIDDTGGGFSSLAPQERIATLEAIMRVLRAGGRAEVIERMTGGLLGGARVVPSEYSQAGGAEGALRAAGLRPVRVLAEKDGFRFIEGLKG
jgi:hypothetical protein